jgi:hypothetical protein
LEVFVNDEAATLQQLNQLCGTKHDIFSSIRIPKRRMLIEMQGLEDEEAKERTMDVGAIGAIREGSSQSKILTHFIKGKISLSLMETILSIPSELEYLESLVKFGRKKKDESVKDTNLVKPNETAANCPGNMYRSYH